MHDKFYPEDDMGHHDIDEDEIAKSLLPYINSLHEMKSIRVYIQTTNNNLLAVRDKKVQYIQTGFM